MKEFTEFMGVKVGRLAQVVADEHPGVTEAEGELVVQAILRELAGSVDVEKVANAIAYVINRATRENIHEKLGYPEAARAALAAAGIPE